MVSTMNLVKVAFGVLAVLFTVKLVEKSLAKHVFISFDFDNDRRYAFLLKALAENPDFEVEFTDRTPGEIQSENISRIKAVLSKKIEESTHVVVLLGKHANTQHQDHAEIGELNWQHWETKTAILKGKKIIGVKIEKPNPMIPMMAGNVNAWAMSYNVPAITKAISEA